MAETIFIVEDDPGIRRELCRLLERYGYRCETTERFDRVAEEIAASGAQLVLLDLNLPRFDGFAVCRELRRRSSVPVIVVTSRDTEADELISLSLGADDFITKPYNTQILLAHIASVLKRVTRRGESSLFTYRGLTLDTDRGVAVCGENSAELTRNEKKLLELLLHRAGEVVSREDMMDELWQSDAFIDDNTLTVNVNRLRRKLESIGWAGRLTTCRGQGYRV